MRFKGRRLTLRQREELLQKEQPVEDAELSRQLKSQVFVLRDGGALWVLGPLTRYVDSVEALREMVAESLQRVQRGPIHMASLLPFGKDFAGHVEELERRLPDAIGLPDLKLDRSERSLKELDRAIRKMPWERLLEGDVLGPMVAYIGEVTRSITGGTWVMRLARDGKTWEPWIEDSGGGRFGPFMFVAELSEHGPRASSWIFVGGTVGFDKN